MLFTSPTFFFYFLPAFLLLFRAGIRKRHLTVLAKIVLVVGTFIFYGAPNTGYLIPFVIATLFDSVWGLSLDRDHKPRVRKLILSLSIAQNLTLFFIFRYLNAVADVLPGWAWLQGLRAAFAGADGTIPLPPGISFYLFESLSFVIDCYWRRIRAPKNPFNFLIFISMFPRFIAGPIVRYSELRDSLEDYRGMRVADGLFLFALGFIVKILFAESFGFLADALFSERAGFLPSWVSLLSFHYQIYLDFSAYSLMAVGLGLAIGFPLPDNFREPYLSLSPSDYWRRWHITLSTWFRDYVYIPLGGNRARGKLNLFITMALAGLWHGAGLHFIVWGLYHGGLLVIERWSPWKWSSRWLTLFCVIIGWVLFRSTSLAQAGAVYTNLVGGNGIGLSVFHLYALNRPLLFAGCALAFIWVEWLEPRVRSVRNGEPWHRLSVEHVPAWSLAIVGALFVVSLSFAVSKSVNPFLYFQF